MTRSSSSSHPLCAGCRTCPNLFPGEYQIVESRAENIFLLLRFNPLAHPPPCQPNPPLYDEDRKLLRSNSQVEQASACSTRVILAPGALSPAHRLTGPLGQISRTEAVEVDFGQSFKGKKVTSRVSARPFPTSWRFRSPRCGAGLKTRAIR